MQFRKKIKFFWLNSRVVFCHAVPGVMGGGGGKSLFEIAHVICVILKSHVLQLIFTLFLP